jgi:hypothetical protein
MSGCPCFNYNFETSARGITRDSSTATNQHITEKTAYICKPTKEEMKMRVTFLLNTTTHMKVFYNIIIYF